MKNVAMLSLFQTATATAVRPTIMVPRNGTIVGVTVSGAAIYGGAGGSGNADIIISTRIDPQTGTGVDESVLVGMRGRVAPSVTWTSMQFVPLQRVVKAGDLIYCYVAAAADTITDGFITLHFIPD